MPNYTILLVDYEPRSIERSRRPLVDAGFRVELASDGVAALEEFERLSPDLVLIEAMLPKKHGFEVCQELKKTPEGKRTPILITTAVYKGRKYRSQALHLHGCDEYIEKPIADDQLVALVRLFIEAAPPKADQREEAPPPTKKGAPATTKATPPAKRASAPVATTPSRPVPLSRDTAAPPPPKVSPAPPPRAGNAAGPDWSADADSLANGLSVDAIMARLDEVLPPEAAGTAASAELAVAVADAEASIEIVAEESDDGSYDLEEAADLLSDTEAEFEAAVMTASTPEFEPLEPTVAPESTDRIPQQALGNAAPFGAKDAGVVPFDAHRSKNRKKERGRDRAVSEGMAEPGISVPRVPDGDEDANREFEFASAMAVAEPRRGIPIWVWTLIVMAIVAGAYFAFVHDGGSAVTRSSTAAPVANSPPEFDAPPPSLATPPDQPATESKSPPTSGSAPETPEVSSAIPAASTIAPTPLRTTAPARGSKTTPSSSPTPRPASPARATAAPPVETVPALSVNAPGDPQSALPAPTLDPLPQPPPVTAAPAIAIDPAGLGIEPVPVQIVTPSASTARRTVMEGDVVPIAAVDRRPIHLSRAAPTYPLRARLARQEGTVLLNVLVTETGQVGDVQVLRGIAGSDLDAAAVKAAWSWTYKPASKDGVRVKVWMQEQVAFLP